MLIVTAGCADSYNQMPSGPRLGLMPWQTGDGLYYIGAGFVQATEDGQVAFYHRVEAGSKLNPASVLQVKAQLITTPVHQTWARPGVAYRHLEHGGDGPASHYPADKVDVTQYHTCCSSKHYMKCTSCPLASPETYNQLVAIPVTYFTSLHNMLSRVDDMFSQYQYELWRHAWEDHDSLVHGSV